jgi:hypothetical protein
VTSILATPVLPEYFTGYDSHKKRQAPIDRNSALAHDFIASQEMRPAIKYGTPYGFAGDPINGSGLGDQGSSNHLVDFFADDARDAGIFFGGDFLDYSAWGDAESDAPSPTSASPTPEQILAFERSLHLVLGPSGPDASHGTRILHFPALMGDSKPGESEGSFTLVAGPTPSTLDGDPLIVPSSIDSAPVPEPTALSVIVLAGATTLLSRRRLKRSNGA